MEDMKEFVAYLRRLRRDLLEIKRALTGKDYARAEELLDELIADTNKDIES